MQTFNFPISFKFNIGTFANDFTATEANGQTVAYVRQKMFKLKEAIDIYSDEGKQHLMATIKADRWLDFSAAYTFYDTQGNDIGKVVRKGWKSIWKSRYEIIDDHQKPEYSITEENAWVKVWDSLFTEIPFVGIFAGYVFNPSYIVQDKSGKVLMRMKKMPSFFGRKFELSRVKENENKDDLRILLSLMMMILLERRKG